LYYRIILISFEINNQLWLVWLEDRHQGWPMSFHVYIHYVSVLTNINVFWYIIQVLFVSLSYHIVCSLIFVFWPSMIKGMTSDISCLYILYDTLDEYLCILMYYTSIIHFNIIYHCLYSSQRWSKCPWFRTCVILGHNMSVSCNGW